MANSIFVIVAFGGQYDDAWESNIEAHLDLAKAEEAMANMIKFDNARKVVIDKIADWRCQWSKDNPLKYDPLIQRPRWPPGIGKNQITNEMITERNRILDENNAISQQNMKNNMENRAAKAFAENEWLTKEGINVEDYDIILNACILGASDKADYRIEELPLIKE